MTTATAEDIVRRFVADVISHGDLDQLDHLLADDYEYHAPGMDIRGREGIRQVFAMLRAGFPDWSETIEDLLVDRDRAVFRVTGRGTHLGEFMGMPPTGREVLVAGIDIVRLDGDVVVEHWAVFDQLGMLRQIGALPA
jgi:steroid delta-isomerase-like uncharacterized protein